MRAANQGPGGWVIGVMVELPGEPKALLHYYAVGHDDQGKAEWTAVDWALREGRVSSSPVGGQEPVEALRRIPAPKMTTLGLKPGEVKPLGWRFPRRWLG
ncbi:hypothetical protein [Phenylobacterium sp. J367]|uniref:hypothetical protein n=1 Tax=Phenylobacterium sp. J367 TaxID=2898435 RepID=UPI0021517B17|nr:hypothetical protein [Phenylobacterium sp. J367]MCR5878719.1 hypothetical protein [Phenylobacterium sp. J367]